MNEGAVFVRLIRFICLWFIAAFAASLLVHYLTIRIELTRVLSIAPQESKIDSLLTAGWRAVMFCIYVVILFGLSYSARYRFAVFPSIIYVLVLSLLWVGLFSAMLGLLQRGSPWPVEPTHHLGGVGLITEAGGQYHVILQVPDLSGTQVLASPDSPLTHESTAVGLGVPTLFFRDDTAATIEGILDKLTYAGERCSVRMQENFVSFFLYVAALVFCLSSLRFVFDASSWPLANLFLGALFFWGVLELGYWLDSRQVQTFIKAIGGESFPLFIVVPVAYCVLGFVFILFSMVQSFIKRRRTPYEDY